MYFLISAGIFIAELFTKNRREKETEEKNCLNGFVRITTYHNHGAFLNSGEKHPRLVAAVSSALTGVLGVFMLSAYGNKNQNKFLLPISLMLGGACSNCCDRLRHGYVVDYIRFPKLPGKLKDIIYNISDFCIFAGGILFCFRSGHGK